MPPAPRLAGGPAGSVFQADSSAPPPPPASESEAQAWALLGGRPETLAGDPVAAAGPAHAADAWVSLQEALAPERLAQAEPSVDPAVESSTPTVPIADASAVPSRGVSTAGAPQLRLCLSGVRGHQIAALLPEALPLPLVPPDLLLRAEYFDAQPAARLLRWSLVAADDAPPASATAGPDPGLVRLRPFGDPGVVSVYKGETARSVLRRILRLAGRAGGGRDADAALPGPGPGPAVAHLALVSEAEPEPELVDPEEPVLGPAWARRGGTRAAYRPDGPALLLLIADDGSGPSLADLTVLTLLPVFTALSRPRHLSLSFARPLPP